MGVGLAQGWGGFQKAAPDVDAAHLVGVATTCKCRIARQRLDAEALTAGRLGHREYEPDKQKPDENANPERARRSVLGPRRTRPEPRLRKSIDGLTKDRSTGLDNLALTIQDLVKRTRVGSRIAILARSEHGTSKPDKRECGIFRGTRGPVFQKGGIHCKKLTHQRLANRCSSGENGDGQRSACAALSAAPKSNTAVA
jgi:hypothetical protein